MIREAAGFAEPRPEDLVREDELSVVQAIELQLSLGFRPVVIERWLRVCADSLRRIAETEADWWRTEIEVPLIQGGIVGRCRMPRPISGPRSLPSTEQALLAMYHGQQEHAWSKSALEDFEDALTGGPAPSAHRPPAICFLDITGYTRLTDERGDEAAAELAGRLAALVQRTSKHGGQPVKWLGDGVMFYFPDPRGVWPPWRWSRGATRGCRRRTSGSTPDPSCSRTATTSAGRSTSPRGSPTTPGSVEVLVTQEVVDAADGRSVCSRRSARSS